jgi:hypothetical protein
MGHMGDAQKAKSYPATMTNLPVRSYNILHLENVVAPTQAFANHLRGTSSPTDLTTKRGFGFGNARNAALKLKQICRKAQLNAVTKFVICLIKFSS